MIPPGEPQGTTLLLRQWVFSLFQGRHICIGRWKQTQLVAWAAESSPSWVLIPTIKSWGGIIFFLSLSLSLFQDPLRRRKMLFFNIASSPLRGYLEELVDFFIFFPYELQRCLGLWASAYSFQEGCLLSSWIGEGGFWTLTNLRRVASFAVRTVE